MEDPTKISSRQEKQVKKYVQDYFEKAVVKKKEHERKKNEGRGKGGEDGAAATAAAALEAKTEEDDDGDQDMPISDDEDSKPKQISATPVTPFDQLLIVEGLKRKRETDDDPDTMDNEGETTTPSKRLKSESPPPPPPPPPVAEMPLDGLDRSSGDMDNLTAAYDSPMDVEYSTRGNDVAEGHRPRPPPPPTDPPNITESKGKEFITNGSIDRHDIESEGDENEPVPGHERPFPRHGREQLPELRI